MNITDFLGNLDVQLNEIEYIGHHGYVNGMTKMIMDTTKKYGYHKEANTLHRRQTRNHVYKR